MRYKFKSSSSNSSYQFNHQLISIYYQVQIKFPGIRGHPTFTHAMRLPSSPKYDRRSQNSRNQRSKKNNKIDFRPTRYQSPFLSETIVVTGDTTPGSQGCDRYHQNSGSVNLRTECVAAECDLGFDAAT